MDANEISLSDVLLVSMIGLFAIAMGSIFIFVVYQKRMLGKDRELQYLETLYQKELLQSTIASQENERRRIAHDLHDEIGVLLSTSKIYFNQLSPGHAEEQLEQVSSKMNGLFDEMMQNIRRISHDLRPVILEKLGLLEAIENLGVKLSETGVDFCFDHQVDFQFSSHADLLLFRIIQELINNTLKHAQATAISIQMEVKGGRFLLSYQDNGIGLPVHNDWKSGLGIKSIESRLSLLDADMELLDSTQGISFLFEMDIQKITRDA